MSSNDLVEREAVRVVLLDAQGSVLLLHTRDLSNENFGSTWELPGGGIEPGESFLDAATREIREETGIVLDAACVGPPAWRREVVYSYRGEQRLQREAIAIARLDCVTPVVTTTQCVAFESEDHFEHRWWAAGDRSRRCSVFSAQPASAIASTTAGRADSRGARSMAVTSYFTFAI
jgi:8-oxo-dGTP pyrophosphatase MutT (NUDIX family)